MLSCGTFPVEFLSSLRVSISQEYSQPLRFNRFRDAPDVNLFRKHDTKLQRVVALFFQIFSQSNSDGGLDFPMDSAVARLS